MELSSHAYRFIHARHLNTPRLITNNVGQPVWRWDNNDPFGGNVPDENPSGLGTFTCNLRSPGTYADKETELLYNWWRTLDSGIGRYIQFDPIGLSGGINGYAYVENNPLSFIDPTGLQAIPLPTPTPPIAGPNSGGTSNIAKALNNLINKIVEACKPDDKKCPPCKLVDGTIVPVGTIAYRPMDTPPPGKVEHGISGPHYNLYKANQNPNNCQCFWQPIGAAKPPPQPDWIPIQPFAN
jgi:RHS repeat-associated protein